MLSFIFDTNSYPARWHCGAWSDFMGWLHISSDTVIFLAYMGIPLVLLYFKNRINVFKINSIFVLFAAFIFCCGVTHLNDAIVFWYPFYNFSGIVKFMTAIVSFATLVVIMAKLPDIVQFLNEKSSSKVLKEIIESCPQGILVVNNSGSIVFANGVAASIFDLKATALSGMVIEQLIPTEYISIHQKLREEFLRNPEKRQMGVGRDLYAVSNKGVRFPVEIGLNPITYNGESCVLCSIVDITERKQKEEELNKLNKSLEISNNELEEFTYIASHDLKEPLRGIHNYSMMLDEEYSDKLDEDGRDKLKKLPKLTQRLESLIDSLLEYSRLGKSDIKMKSLNVNQILDESKELISYPIKDKNVEIEVQPDLPEIIGDEYRIIELFNNLFSNAIKYNETKNPKIKVGLLDDRQDGKLTFYVKDNGIGIKEEHISKIFTIFKRLHARDKFGGGTGVGLTIVKKIIDKHGGKIWVESTQGEGTTFYFTLQRADNIPQNPL